MTKWIRWWGLGLFVGLALLWWLCIDLVIEKSIEFAGTQAVGARVELDSAELTLSPLSLTLNRLQVTNPEEPMQNLVEIGRIATAIASAPLLRRQFIAEEMNVEALQLYTPRESSGAIEGRLFSFKGDDREGGMDVSGLLAGLNLPDTDALVAQEKERLLAEIAQVNNEIDSLQSGWKQRIEQLPDDADIAAYKERAQALKKANPLEKVTGARELKKDIDKDLDAIKTSKEQLAQDSEHVKALIARAKNMPGQEADRLLASVGLDQGFDGLLRNLLGDRVNTWLQRGIALYKASAGELSDGRVTAEEEPPKPPRGQGIDIRFAEEQPLPRFLIKRAAVSGIAPIGTQTIEFAGDILDITDEQALWGRPTTLKVSGAAATGASLKLDGIFDHRTAQASDALNFALARLSLASMSLSTSDKLPITLERGLADIQGKLALNGDALDASINSLVQQANFLTAETVESKTAELVSRALRGVSQFDLRLALDGTLDDPAIKLRSSLDKILGDAIGAEFKAKVAEKKAELQAKLQEQIAPQLAALQGRSDALAGYRQSADDKGDALSGLLKDLR